MFEELAELLEDGGGRVEERRAVLNVGHVVRLSPTGKVRETIGTQYKQYKKCKVKRRV